MTLKSCGKRKCPLLPGKRSKENKCLKERVRILYMDFHGWAGPQRDPDTMTGKGTLTKQGDADLRLLRQVLSSKVGLSVGGTF